MALAYPEVVPASGHCGSLPLARSSHGRYELLGQLAAGGMAEVYLGRIRGPEAFERPVAVKRILPHLARDRMFVDLFVREAQIAASIHHARVVQVHELTMIGGNYAIVMEYVEGENLGGLMRRLWMRGESLDRTLAAHIIAEACAGLHAAHELTDRDGRARELVHRDISPQNIMITYAGEVKVLDFGIAKATDSARTQGGQIRGKCEYMSPEQCRGERLDRRSDVFSLGIVLYESTTGRRLFKRDNAMLTFQAVCHDPIPAPVEIDPGFPPALAAICARALARDQRERYATARDMRRDLIAAIRGMSGTGWNGGEDEALAGLMSRLFADRMAEKRAMLDQVRAGLEVGHVAVADVDTQVEIPGVPTVSRPRQPRACARWSPRLVARRRLIAAVVALVLVLVLVALVVLMVLLVTLREPRGSAAALAAPHAAAPRPPCSLELPCGDASAGPTVPPDEHSPAGAHVVPGGAPQRIAPARSSTAKPAPPRRARAAPPPADVVPEFERFE